MYSEIALSRKPLGIGHMYIHNFLLRMAYTTSMTSQNIHLSSWDILYTMNFSMSHFTHCSPVRCCECLVPTVIMCSIIPLSSLIFQCVFGQLLKQRVCCLFVSFGILLFISGPAALGVGGWCYCRYVLATFVTGRWEEWNFIKLYEYKRTNFQLCSSSA
jgi:hypothetical protein